MATDYKETEVDETDTETKVLGALADGNPFVFIVGRVDSEGEVHIQAATGGGITNADTVKNLLNMTLAAMP